MTERISDDELAFHIRVVDQIRAAKNVEAAWMSHLYTKYKMTPGDLFDESGNINRRFPFPVEPRPEEEAESDAEHKADPEGT